MSDTNNVKLGVCKIFYGGVDLGYTKGGVEVTVTTSTHEVKVDQFGETPINEIITGRQVNVKAPLAETTLDNLIATMPGATLISTGAKASGTITFATAVPVEGDKVIVNGVEYTFKASPSAATDMPIPASLNAAAAALADRLNMHMLNVVTASVSGATVTVTAVRRGTAGNAITLSKQFTEPSNLTLSGATLSGGADPVNGERVDVKTGVNTSLLALAKELRLRPLGTEGDEDFVVYRAACPGALNFAYQADNERVFNAEFKGYPDAQDRVFGFGNQNAVAA